MRNVFWRYTILCLPTFDRNDICSLPHATKRKGSADFRYGSRSSLPKFTLQKHFGAAPSQAARLQVYITSSPPQRDSTPYCVTVEPCLIKSG